MISCRPIGNGSPNRSKISYHAEEEALRELRRVRPDAIRKGGRGYTLTIYNSRGDNAPSRPCKRCKKMLESIVPEINVVYTYQGEIHQCIPVNIKDTQYSRGILRRS